MSFLTLRMKETKTYIGDGVYAEYDEFETIWLTTENGIAITNRIALERDVLESFLEWIKVHVKEPPR